MKVCLFSILPKEILERLLYFVVLHFYVHGKLRDAISIGDYLEMLCNVYPMSKVWRHAVSHAYSKMQNCNLPGSWCTWVKTPVLLQHSQEPKHKWLTCTYGAYSKTDIFYFAQSHETNDFALCVHNPYTKAFSLEIIENWPVLASRESRTNFSFAVSDCGTTLIVNTSAGIHFQTFCIRRAADNKLSISDVDSQNAGDIWGNRPVAVSSKFFVAMNFALCHTTLTSIENGVSTYLLQDMALCRKQIDCHFQDACVKIAYATSSARTLKTVHYKDAKFETVTQFAMNYRYQQTPMSLVRLVNPPSHDGDGAMLTVFEDGMTLISLSGMKDEVSCSFEYRYVLSAVLLQNDFVGVIRCSRDHNGALHKKDRTLDVFRTSNLTILYRLPNVCWDGNGWAPTVMTHGLYFDCMPRSYPYRFGCFLPWRNTVLTTDLAMFRMSLSSVYMPNDLDDSSLIFLACFVSKCFQKSGISFFGKRTTHGQFLDMYFKLEQQDQRQIVKLAKDAAKGRELKSLFEYDFPYNWQKVNTEIQVVTEIVIRLLS